MDHDIPDNSVAVRHCASLREAEQYALVLSAMGVKWSIVGQGRGAVLYVAQDDAARAGDELSAYDRENAQRPPQPKERRMALPRIEGAMIYWTVLLFFFAAGRHQALSFDWLSEGAAQAGLMRGGEWWRAVTALYLHADATHLLGNLVFGMVFLMALAQITGTGLAFLAMIAAGTFGNAVNVFLHSPAHTAIGASTAIFAALGVLAALQQMRRADRALFTMRSLAPLAGGVTLLVFLGLSGENTDILAHILGFLSGIALGLVLGRSERDWRADHRLQWRCAGLAGAVTIGAWVAAAV